MYTVAFIIVFCLFGIPSIKKMPIKYYICGLGCAMGCSLTFAFSLSYAQGGTQTMEVGMINYLWPSLTILFAVIFNGQKAKWWLAIGMIIAIYGISVVLGNNLVLDIETMIIHIQSNPLSYLLALFAAIFWAAYSNFTKAWAKAQNPTVLIFGLDFLLFNMLWLTGYGDSKPWNFSGSLVAIIGATVMGLAYGFWTIGVQKGNITVLSIFSYFTPVLSCLFASILIGAELTSTFWLGVGLVVLASFICWRATVTNVNTLSKQSKKGLNT